MARRSQSRETRKTFVVLGDGITEQYYLKHLKEIKGYKYSIRPSLFESITFENAECIINEYISGGCNNIVYLTDYDTIVQQDKTAEFERFKSKFRDCREVLICETMPSIEFWFLLHYEHTTREFRNSGEVERKLKTYLSDYSKAKSFLESKRWVEKLMVDDKLEKAKTSSNQILNQKLSGIYGTHFPFSEVHKAIEKFDSFE